MRMRVHRWWPAGAGLALLACVPAAWGQLGYMASVDDLTNRPSTRGPSLNLGGRYTRFDMGPLESTRQPNSLTGESFLPSFRSPRNGTYWNSSRLGVSELGYLEDTGMAAWDPGGPIRETASVISGLSAAQSFARLLPGTRMRQLPAVEGFLFTPRPDSTRVQLRLGVQPLPAAPVGGPGPKLAVELQNQTKSQAALKFEEAKALFKSATVEPRKFDELMGVWKYPTCGDCAEKLYQAAASLNIARDMDQQSALPLVLAAHANLEQDQPMSAASNLIRAFQREPQFFLSCRPIDEYFGDGSKETGSQFLREQMQRYERINDPDPPPQRRLLEAYCAWRLGETDRMNAAVDAVQQAAQTAPEISGLLPLLIGLQNSRRGAAVVDAVAPSKAGTTEQPLIYLPGR